MVKANIIACKRSGIIRNIQSLGRRKERKGKEAEHGGGVEVCEGSPIRKRRKRGRRKCRKVKKRKVFGRVREIGRKEIDDRGKRREEKSIS